MRKRRAMKSAAVLVIPSESEVYKVMPRVFSPGCTWWYLTIYICPTFENLVHRVDLYDGNLFDLFGQPAAGRSEANAVFARSYFDTQYPS